MQQVRAGLSRYGGGSEDLLLPARMLNEYVYCPRLFYLEWVQGEWQESADTVEGRFHHRRVDREGGVLPEVGAVGPVEGQRCRDSGEEGEREESGGREAAGEWAWTGRPGAARKESGDAAGSPQDEEPTVHARSVLLSSPELRLVAKIDLVEGDGREVMPVDYKRGAVPDNPERSWEADRVQLCAQALLLRQHGFRCHRGIIYYVASRQRVVVDITPELELRTRQLIEEALALATTGQVPPPLVDSPKCPRCSLVGVCLPDEVNYLRAGTAEPPVGTDEMPGPTPDAAGPDVRRLFAARYDALPLYVQEQGAAVRRKGDRLVVTVNGETRADIRMLDVSQVCLVGNVQISPQALRDVASRGIPICHFSYGGWFTAITVGFTNRNVELRQKQYEAAGDPERCLALARRFVAAKIANSRVLLRRNHPGRPAEVVDALGRLAEQAATTGSVDSLLGVEGTAARMYFSQFGGMLKPPEGVSSDFDFEGRNRRPPRDPVNALLSYAYSLLTKDFTVVLLAVGFDPYMGFFHRPKWGKPALALDLMEEFRPVIADSVVLTVINNGELKAGDFVWRAGGVMLTEGGRRKFIEAYERRLDTMVRHPVFGYSISYRRVFEVQARLLGRYLLGEIPEYPAFLVR